MSWAPSSWRQKAIQQAPKYPDQNQLKQVEKNISKYPPLVVESEILKLKNQLARVSRGEALLLQGGDCAESFSEFSFDNIRDNFRVMLQMAIVMTFGVQRPVVKIGRTAGQFAKPRSADTEIRAGLSLPTYRGDIINGHAFTPEERIHDPARMERAYFQAAATLNLLRALAKGGFADLQQAQAWNLEFIQKSNSSSRYEIFAKKIDEALAFVRTTGMKLDSASDLSTVDLFTSHEMLLLNYEEALVRKSEAAPGFYASSAHMLWIGDRTRQADGAHIEFARGVKNPIGLKCGPELRSDELLRLIDILNPENEAGRLTLITRFGSQKIEDRLPEFIRRTKAEGHHLVWCCDPMHGNTYTTDQGIKTRSFEKILSETKLFFNIHKAEGTVAGGVHLELTGRNVTECIGGQHGINETHIDSVNYETLCDPRLNADQALELAFLLVDKN